MQTFFFLRIVQPVLLAVVVLVASTADAKSLGLDVKGSIIEAYDDNVTFSESNRKADFITNLKLGVALKQEGKTHTLDFEGNVTQHIFADNGEFNNSSQDFKVNLTKELSRYDRLQLTDTFVRAEEARSFEDEFGRTSGRYNSTRNRVGLAWDHDFSSQLSSELHYNNAVDYFSRADLRDSSLHQAGAGLNYTYDSATIFNLFYDYTKRLFDKGPDATINSITTGLRRYLTPQLYFDLAAGPDFIHSFNGTDYVKPHFSLALTDLVDENTQVSLTFNREYTTTASTQDLFNSWRTALDFSRKFTERVDASAEFFYGEGTYVASDVTDALWGIKTGVNYAINPDIKTGLGYSFTKSDSDNDGNDYRRNYSYMNLTFSF